MQLTVFFFLGGRHRSSATAPHWRHYAPVIAGVFLAALSGLAAARGSDDAGYAISIGDVLQLDFLDDQAEAYVVSVGGDGTVQLPFLGTVDLLGMPLAEAGETIVALYVDNDILIAPRIDLSVLNLRPFSVLGDVTAPGFFDYRPGISVEQAVGLAGGPVRAFAGEEARSLQRLSLRAEVAVVEASMLREAAAEARLTAQLAAAERIDIDAVHVADIPQPDRSLIEALVAQDDEIIAAERVHFQQTRALLEQAIVEINRQITLTHEQIAAQNRQIDSYDAELARNEELTERGLVTAPVLARLQRQVADEETTLLRLETGLAATQRELTGLQRQVLDLDFGRVQRWRLDLAEVKTRAAQLRATRASVLDRLALLEDWSTRAAGTETGLKLEYIVRRRTPDGGQVTISVGGTDALAPGDVLIVRLLRPLPASADGGVPG